MMSRHSLCSLANFLFAFLQRLKVVVVVVVKRESVDDEEKKESQQ
jgi:hypothetical protein